MRDKTLSNKEILQDLIDKIKEIKRITQGQISLLAGYESENYLSEAKSTDCVTDNIIKSVKSLYERAKANPDILTDKDKSINVSQSLSELTGERIELTAAMRAAIKILTLKCIEQEVKISEIEAKLLKDKTFMQSFSDVSLELEKKMQDETEHILDEWRKK